MNKIQQQTIEFLKNLTTQNYKIYELNNKIDELEAKILEYSNEDDYKHGHEIIDCGIGNITYNFTGSMQLGQLMESLERAIKNHNTIYIEQVLDLLAKQ